MADGTVDYTEQNVKRCICGDCPVFKASKCAGKKWEEIEPMLNEGELPEPDDMEGLYCCEDVGPTECDDFDDSESCICPSCPVYQENNLEGKYFCI